MWFTHTHTHSEITTNLSNTSRCCKSRSAGVGFCVSSALYSAAAYGFGYNSFLRAPARRPAASPIGLLLFLFLCCSNIAFPGSLTWEQSAWIFTAAVIPFFPPPNHRKGWPPPAGVVNLSHSFSAIPPYLPLMTPIVAFCHKRSFVKPRCDNDRYK